MKTLLLALACLTPFAAHADFISGRVRVGSVAKMKVISATGALSNVKEATLEAEFEDGKAGAQGYVLKVNGLDTHLKISSVKGGDCGYVTNLEMDQITTSTTRVVAQLTDYSAATCEIAVPNIWTIEVRATSMQTGVTSTIVLGGNPERLNLTL